MQIPVVIISLLGCAAAAWWLTKAYENMKHTGRTRELESKIRLAQGETYQLREQLSLLKGEVSVLQKTLSEERVSKQSALSSLTESFKRGILATGMAALAAGVLVGGGVSWQAATWRTEARAMKNSYETDLQHRLNALKVEFMEKQMTRYEKELHQYQMAWHEEQVEKAVAQTKLEIIMNSLAPQKGVEGFSLDYKKLKNGLKQDSDRNLMAADEMPLLKPAFKS